jgi:hypothetical protein
MVGPWSKCYFSNFKLDTKYRKFVILDVCAAQQADTEYSRWMFD